jgi:hypothetical protein
MRRENPTESPLGFWLETVFNHVDFVRRTQNPVLKKPPILEEQIYYPIKASYFEDIQQIDFWVSDSPGGKKKY